MAKRKKKSKVTPKKKKAKAKKPATKKGKKAAPKASAKKSVGFIPPFERMKEPPEETHEPSVEVEAEAIEEGDEEIGVNGKMDEEEKDF